MKRVLLPERANWQQAHQEIGFDYYNLPSRDGSMYWSEGVAYEFSLKQIEQLEDASNELHQMCLEVAGDDSTWSLSRIFSNPPSSDSFD